MRVAARAIPSWLRGYERPWLRADVIAGALLAYALLRVARIHRTIQDAVDAVLGGEVNPQD
jgi:MFS superfamily sulfate permease-like transporter